MSSQRLKLPKIEDEIEFNTNRNQQGFGTPHLKQRRKDLVLRNPEFYIDPYELHTEKYNWEILDDVHYHQYRPSTGGDGLLRFPKELPPEKTASKVIIGNVVYPKFEVRRQEMRKALKLLKTANTKLRSKGLKPVVPSEKVAQIPHTSHTSHSEKTPKSPEIPDIYTQGTTLKSRLRVSIDHVPILKDPYILQPEDVTKAYAARTYPITSAHNVWPDSEFLIAKDNLVAVNHIEKCATDSFRARKKLEEDDVSSEDSDEYYHDLDL